MSLINERTSARNRISDNDRVLRGASLIWRRDGADWVLFSGRRRFGRVVGDSKYPEMWRSTLERELKWEARQRAAIAPSKCPEKRGIFEGSAPPIAPNERGVL